MAANNSRAFAPGVRVTEGWNGDEYLGIAEALVAAGVAHADQFPGQPGMAKSCATFYDGQRVGRGGRRERDERFLCVQTVGKKFKVTRGVSHEVKAERRAVMEAEWDAERETEREFAAARAGAERRIARSKMIAEGTLVLMPTSPNEYREKLVEDWDLHVSIVRDALLPSKGDGSDMFSMGANGFSLDESDLSEFDDLANEIKRLLTNAGVRFNVQRQKEIISSCQGAVAKGDTKFQRVLAACIE